MESASKIKSLRPESKSAGSDEQLMLWDIVA
jgi:hypothetical protein